MQSIVPLGMLVNKIVLVRVPFYLSRHDINISYFKQ